MPRMRVWLAGLVLAVGTTYFTYTNVYIPRLALEVGDAHFVMERQSFQRAVQLFAALKAIETVSSPSTSSPLLTSSSSSSPSSPITSSVFYTNREKLLFFLDIQHLRTLLMHLPLNTQTRREKIDMLRELQDMERRHCSPLNFRDEAMTYTQRCVCALFYVVYVACFKVLPFLWPCDGVTRRRFQHAVATRITAALEIDCELTVAPRHTASLVDNEDDEIDNSSSSRLESDQQGSFEEKEEKVQECSGDDDSRAIMVTRRREQAYMRDARFLVMNPEHWIEEVGFWSCSNNPMMNEVDEEDMNRNEPGGKYKLPRPQLAHTPAWELVYRSCQLMACCGEHTRVPATAAAGGAGGNADSTSNDEDISKLKRCCCRCCCKFDSLVRWCSTMSSLYGLAPLLLQNPSGTAFSISYQQYWAGAWVRKEAIDARCLDRLRAHLHQDGNSGGEKQAQISSSMMSSPSAWESEAASAQRLGDKMIDDACIDDDESSSSSLKMSSGACVSIGYPRTTDVANIDQFHSLCVATDAANCSNSEPSHDLLESRSARSLNSSADEATGGVLGEDRTPRWLPVGTAGLPRVLYINNELSRCDVRPRMSSKVVYQQLQQQQYPESRATVASLAPFTVKKDRKDAGQDALANDSACKGFVERCHTWGGFPCWSRAWWCGVYGGTAQGGNRGRRVLRYHIGTLCTAQELPMGLIEATRKATEEMYLV